MKELFSLGKLYPSDFLHDGELPACPPHELKLLLDENGTARLESQPPPHTMWGKYWYRSSISNTMKYQLYDVVASVTNNMKLQDGQIWADIGGNDGYMLSEVPAFMTKINIDPCDDSFKTEAEKRCDLVIQSFFTAGVYKNSKFGKVKAKIVSCISMFYDLDNPGQFLDDVNEILDDNGLFVMQLSYTPLMLEQMEFTNICHEHMYYYSLFNIKGLLEKHGFKIMDVTLNNTNCGSFRLHIMKDGANENVYSSQTNRDVCKFRIASLLEYEKTLKLDDVETWKNFFERITDIMVRTKKFISNAKFNGKTIMGYGASTKFNTLLQYFGLTQEHVTAIAERSSAKYGTRTVGSGIPIISEDEMRRAKPDYLLVGPAHFLSEFMEREKDFLDDGGKFIVTMPSFQVIGK